MSEKEKIARRIARAGICSRREAEKLVEAGRVVVNGQRVETPAMRVAATDKVAVDGKELAAKEPAQLWRYHKPAGLVTTNSDEKGRMTIFDTFPADFPRVMTVGRLDMNTEGLLLLTNDGDLARYMELPETGWTRRYRVRVFGQVDEAALQGLKRGIEIDGIKYKSIKAELDEKQQGRNAWLSVALTEGKNREIRKVMEALGLQVNRLIRIAYGPFQLGNLDKGVIEEVSKKALRSAISKNLADKIL
ncbi:MAG: rRNA pseudouridine synthase [Micavibrio sp.]|nr:MAG: rRNA pseudouridine synthase [Micavibrio sp.]